MNRRAFLNKSAVGSAGLIAGLNASETSFAKNSPNDTINVAVVGLRNRGRNHYKALAKIKNVKVAVLCDIDQRLLPGAVAEVEKLTGYKPKTETDFRKVLENKDIDAVSLATPNHWHALQTIWACQAGKDVYVEKPVSHTLLEGRKMVEAARKYNRVVQTGTQARSGEATNSAIQLLQNNGLGEIYMARGLCLKPRASIGHTKDTAIPEGVDWDLFLGPAPYRPFNENRFQYRWHWFWETGNGDLGNQGIHQADIARWALNKRKHPVRIIGMGNYFILDSDQETPNIQNISYEYEDGSILEFEVRGLGTNPEAADVRIGNIIYGSKGWMRIADEDTGTYQAHFADIQLLPIGYSSYHEEAGPLFTKKDTSPTAAEDSHFRNFIDCVSSRNWHDLHADILEGHLSSSLCHLGNIACRLKRTLEFDPYSEQFVNDAEADRYLTQMYREPFVLPSQV